MRYMGQNIIKIYLYFNKITKISKISLIKKIIRIYQILIINGDDF